MTSVERKRKKMKEVDEPSSYWCSVPGCTSDGRKKANLFVYPWMKGVTFHAYPGPRRNPTLRRKWLNQIFREEKYVPGRHHRVCSLHFVDGCPSKENPVPTLFPRNNFGGDPPTKRSRTSIEKRQVLSDTNDIHIDVTNSQEASPVDPAMGVTLLADGSIIPMPVQSESSVTTTEMKQEDTKQETIIATHTKDYKTDHEYSAAHRRYPEFRDMVIQTELSMRDVNIMESESTSYGKDNIFLDLFVQKATRSDASVRKYFGLPSITILYGLFCILENACAKLKY